MKHDPAEACRFFSAEDACRYALAAYYAASHALTPPSGEPWFIQGEPYAVASDFAEAFCQEVADRVSAEAYSQHLRRSGSTIDGPWWPNNDEQLTESGEVFLQRLMKHLPPLDNPGNNRATHEVENG